MDYFIKNIELRTIFVFISIKKITIQKIVLKNKKYCFSPNFVIILTYHSKCNNKNLNKNRIKSILVTEYSEKWIFNLLKIHFLRKKEKISEIAKYFIEYER